MTKQERIVMFRRIMKTIRTHLVNLDDEDFLMFKVNAVNSVMSQK